LCCGAQQRLRHNTLWDVNEMIKRITLLAVAHVSIGVAVRVSSAPKSHAAETKRAQTKVAARSKALDSQHTQWIAQSLREMQTIKVGMTRAQLTKVFTTEGGLSTRTWRRYAYRECPYIKVDVDFRPVGTSKKYPNVESRNDVITKISKPFLEWSIQG
jgi:hypothetical protein